MKKLGTGDCCDSAQTDKVIDRDCGRGEGGTGKKAKVTHHVGGKSVSEKSQVTRNCKNVFEESNSKTQYFVREVKGRRMTKNGVEFLIGCRDFPL